MEFRKMWSLEVVFATIFMKTFDFFSVFIKFSKKAIERRKLNLKNLIEWTYSLWGSSAAAKKKFQKISWFKNDNNLKL